MSNWDWDWLLDGSGPKPEDFMTPRPDEDSSATQVSAYGPPMTIRDPNATPSPDTDTPSARSVADALGAAGYFPDGAAAFARNVVRWGGGDPKALGPLDHTMPYLTGPLAVGSGIAGTLSDIDQGTSPLDAIVGNVVRGGLVYGAGAGVGAFTDGIGSIPASIAADRILPPAPQLGHAITRGILDPPAPSPTVIYPAQLGGRPW